MSKDERLSLLSNYASRILSTGPYTLDAFSELCSTLYVLDRYGVNVSDLLRKFRLLLENNLNLWIGFSIDLVKTDADSVSLLFSVSLKHDKEFAEKLRHIADDVTGFQMPDGRIIMGDHLRLTRLLINMLGTENKNTAKALDYIVTSILPRAESITTIVEIAYTLSYTQDLLQKFKKLLRPIATNIVSLQTVDGSWNNNVELTGMATRFLIMMSKKIYGNEIERSIKWLKEKMNTPGLKVNEIREIMKWLKELEIQPIEINFPMVIINEDESEHIEELIYTAAKSIFLINTPPKYITTFIKKVTQNKSLTLRLLIGPLSNKESIEELSKIGFIISETDLAIKMIIIDDDIVIFNVNAQDHDVFLIIKQTGLEDLLWSHFKK